MNVDTLPEDGLHRVATAVVAVDAPIPAMPVAVIRDSAPGDPAGRACPVMAKPL